MRTIQSTILVTVLAALISCNNSSSDQANTNSKDTSSKDTSSYSHSVQNTSKSTEDVVSDYLSLKDALTRDKGEEAASSAKEMGEALAKIDASSLTADQKKVYDDVKDDIKEHAEHIAANGSNIKHQREHFDLLSKDVIDLVKVTGSSKSLYKDFCPMYNNKKGAYWLSESKEIKNPYYGQEMPKCGEVKEEIKPKG